MTRGPIRRRKPGARRHPWLTLAVVLALVGALTAASSNGRGQVAAPEPRPSLLIVTVDSLRFDGGDPAAFGARGAVPAWLEKRGVHFTTAVSGGDWTIASFLAMLSGRYPSESGVVGGTTELSPAGPLLAEILRRSGYATSAILSNPNLGLNGYGLKRGFDSYDATDGGSLNRAEGKPNFGARNAAEITADSLKALRALRGQGRPWFLWVHYFEPHGPYYVPPGYPQTARQPGEPLPLARGDLPEPGTLPAYQKTDVCRGRGDYLARYRASTRWVLDQVDSFFSSAQREGLLDSTFVAYTADHGEALGERNFWFQHGNGIHPALVHVPLVLVPPGSRERKADDRPVSHLDLLPTIVSFLGTPPPPNVVGVDLLGSPSGRRHPILTESTFLRNRMEVGIWLDDALVVRSAFAPPMAYRRTAVGWAESAPDEALTRRAGEALRPHVHRIQTVTPRPQKLSDEEMKMLRSLGYLGGS